MSITKKTKQESKIDLQQPEVKRWWKDYLVGIYGGLISGLIVAYAIPTANANDNQLTGRFLFIMVVASL